MITDPDSDAYAASSEREPDFGGGDFEPEGYYGSSDEGTSVETYMLENPTAAVLIALGVGLVVGLLVAALKPSPPKNRALHLLDELKQKLADAGEETTGKVKEGADAIRSIDLERTISKLTSRLRKLV